MAKKNLSKEQLKVISELKNGAYLLYDGVVCEFKNTNARCNVQTFKYLLKLGVITDTEHFSTALDEKKYILSENFNQ